MMSLLTHGRRRTAVVLTALVVPLAACGVEGVEPEAATSSAPAAREVAGTRLAVTYDGGVMVLDRSSLDVVADLPQEGFLRVNPAHDGRHVLVSGAEGFTLLDTGVEVKAHGDHAHYYGSDPVMTNVTYAAPEPGHVVDHSDRVALFADGTGVARVLTADQVATGAEGRTFTSAAAHHGVAVPLPDDHLLVSLGTEEARFGAQVVDAAGTEVARNEECPGVHGEAAAKGDAVVIGCTDGVLLHSDEGFTKIDSPDAYGRIGNQAGSSESTVVLGDYKVDEDAELERPERVSLIDTTKKTLRLVDLGTSYTFRSLARGPEGEALVLGTDGAVHVIDPSSGEVTKKIKAVAPWREPMDWQQARPTIKTEGSLAYVTEPATSTIHVLDLREGEVVDSVAVPHVPNEVSGVGDTGEH